MAVPTDAQPPKSLFSRIICRLGLEKQVRVVRQNLGIIISGLIIATVFGLWALRILHRVLAWSTFGPTARLVVTDPQVLIHIRTSYLLAFLSSIPAIEVACFLAALAAILLLARLTVNGVNVYRLLRERIHAQQYEHH